MNAVTTDTAKLKKKRKIPDITLYLLAILPIAHYILFKYVPMFGIVIAFQTFNPIRGIFGSRFVGLDNFKMIFGQAIFLKSVRNTLILSLGDLLIGFPAPIILALLINEMRGKIYKRLSQQIVYLPHFISWVIIGGLVAQIFGTIGAVNLALQNLGFTRIGFLSDPNAWLFVYFFVGVWQSAGWGTIIYLAALSGVSEELYEAARVDGCGRFRLMWNITLPSIRGTIAVVLVLGLGGIVNVGFDKIYALATPNVMEYADVLSLYTYRVGIQSLQYGVASAAGLFQGVIVLILVVTSNWISKKASGEGLLW